MSDEWRWVPLGDATVSEDSKRRPVKEADRTPGPYPYWGASGVLDFVSDYIFDYPTLLVSEDGENLKTRKTPIAFHATGKYWVNNHAHVLRAREHFDLEFLAHAVQNSDISGYLTGSTQPKLTAGNLAKIPLWCPSVTEQRRIAGVLGALDDLIEVNRGLIQDLTSMGDAVMDRWAEGVGSTVALGDVIEVVREGWDVNDSDKESVYLGLEHFGTDAVGLVERGTTSGITSQKSLFQVGDVLYGKLRPYFRKVARPGFAGVCTTEAWVMRGRGEVSQEFVHWVARSPRFTEMAVAGSEGTKMPRANWSHLSSMTVPDPKSPGMSAVSGAVHTLWQAGESLNEEIGDLEASRNELLPLLMSGRVRVGDAAA